jgi:hypothetical protein
MRIYCRADQEIADLVDTLSSKPLTGGGSPADERQPAMSPWKIYLVHCKPPSPTNGARSKLLSTAPTPKVKSSYLIVRSDHALFDGVSLVAILLNGLVDGKAAAAGSGNNADDNKLCLNAFRETSRLKRWWTEFCALFLAFGNLLKHSLLDEQDKNPFVQSRPSLLATSRGGGEANH